MQDPKWIPNVAEFYFDSLLVKFAPTAQSGVAAVKGPAYKAAYVHGVEQLRAGGRRWPALPALLSRCTRMRVSPALEESDRTKWPPLPTVAEVVLTLEGADSQAPLLRERHLAAQLAAFKLEAVEEIGLGDCIFHSLRSLLRQLSPAELELLKTTPEAKALIAASLEPGPEGTVEEAPEDDDKAGQEQLDARVIKQREALRVIMEKNRDWISDFGEEYQGEYDFVEELGEYQHSDVYIPAMAHELKFRTRLFTEDADGPTELQLHDMPQTESDQRPWLNFVHISSGQHYNSTRPAKKSAAAKAKEKSGKSSGADSVAEGGGGAAAGSVAEGGGGAAAGSVAGGGGGAAADSVAGGGGGAAAGSVAGGGGGAAADSVAGGGGGGEMESVVGEVPQSPSDDERPLVSISEAQQHRADAVANKPEIQKDSQASAAGAIGGGAADEAATAAAGAKKRGRGQQQSTCAATHSSLIQLHVTLTSLSLFDVCLSDCQPPTKKERRQQKRKQPRKKKWMKVSNMGGRTRGHSTLRMQMSHGMSIAVVFLLTAAATAAAAAAKGKKGGSPASVSGGFSFTAEATPDATVQRLQRRSRRRTSTDSSDSTR